MRRCQDCSQPLRRIEREGLSLFGCPRCFARTASEFLDKLALVDSQEALDDLVGKPPQPSPAPKKYTLSEVAELLETEGHRRKARMELTQGVALQFAADWIREEEGA